MQGASAGQFIVSKLGKLLVDEVQDIRGVGDKMLLLIDELATMNAVLRTISEADPGSVDHLVREWEKQVCELAYTAEDCADTYWLRDRRRPMAFQFPSAIVKWPKYKLQKLLEQRALAADIKALLARTTAVSERRSRYGIDRKTLPRSPWFAPASASSANALRRADDPDDQFVGIREQVSTLAERIRKVEDAGDKRLKVFSIVGFGGLGKTTLAVELCRHLDADFQQQTMVSVSQAFDGGKDIKGLLVRMLQQMVIKAKEDVDKQTNTEGNELNEMNVEGLSTKLKELLKDKRYLIVVDDVWSVPAWEAICIRLPEKNNHGSRIIVTTRIETLAKTSSVSEDLVHHMKLLEPEDSEKLFIKRVFGSNGTCPDGLKDAMDKILKNGLKDAMDKILKKCGGLPLAIVSIASLLASCNSAESVEMWERVSKSIGSHMESHPTLEGMRQVITLSYDYLPHHLKACMMYLSIFPEDYMIAKDRLLYRWIAEGLVAEKRGLTLFDVAEEYFNELISRNMIQPDNLVSKVGGYSLPDVVYTEEVEVCRVHDMMLEVMVSKSQEVNFVSLVGREYTRGLSHGKVRRLSVHGGNDDEHSGATKKKVQQRRRVRHGIEAMDLEHVRSLTTFQLEGLNKLLDRLVEFKLLRVLDLEDCKALKNKHMKYICYMYLLRYLSLRGTNISVMPSKIGNLEYLETLDIERTGIEGMLPTVTKLSKLERFRVNHWILTPGLENMKALREVRHTHLSKGGAKVAREIGELQQLQDLHLYVDVDKEAEQDFFSTLGSSLSKACALRSLHLISKMTLDFLLHVSSPPPLLRHLDMDGPLSQFPDWISSLKHLVEFAVSRTKFAAEQALDSLCKLPRLKTINLWHHSCGDQELVARTKHNFPALRTLCLSLAGQHLEVVRFEEGSMAELETLVLFYREKVVSIFGIGNLKNLKEVKLCGWQNKPLLEHAAKQLKVENENRPESNQIKFVVEPW